MVTLDDISLADITLDTIPLVKRLRELHFATRTAVCIERADLMTGWFMQYDSGDADPQELRAGAVAHYLSNRVATFHDDNPIGGATTSKPIGAPLYPEFMGLAIWPELDTISKRKANPQSMTAEEIDTCNFKIFPYWMDRTVLEVTRRKFESPLSLQLLEKIVYYISGKAGCISHCVPDYSRALTEGLNVIIDEAAQRERAYIGNPTGDPEVGRSLAFFRAVQASLKGIINYATSIARAAAEKARSESDPVKKKNFEMIADICSRVPEHPARTFREAVNALWLCQVGIHAENINMAMSPGRLDQVLYPFFKRDYEAGELSLKEAVEIGCCLWLKIADNTNLVPEAAERLWGGAGSTPAVTLGGVDKNGGDAVNDLTYVFLKVTELMRLRDPSVNARFHPDVNEHRYRQRVVEVITSTKAIPAFHNDLTDIATLVNQGETLEHARDYAVVGCVELASTGRDYVASSSIMFNLASALELALFNGKKPSVSDDQVGPQTGEAESFADFESFYRAFHTQLTWLLGRAIDLNEKMGSVHQEMVTTPLLSSFFEGPLDNGNDLVFGGARYNSSGASFLAFPDVCDSLNAIEQTVFTGKKYSLRQLLDGIRSDFSTSEGKAIQLYLKNKTVRFGTESPEALCNSQRLVNDIYAFLQSHTNYRGGTYRPAFWTMTTHAGQGRLAGALPSGRGAHEVFSSGITPASQA
ncbi:MAG: hypothetical protein JW863_20585, partial [Chitinispirillaceae bacterium]|nr:hypothetical protein [Chitinispirillaceae bacterium]